MYRKNTAGQFFFFALIDVSTGAPLLGATVTVRRTIDNGTQVLGTGTVTHMGNGQYRYAIPQAETNGSSVGFLITAPNAIPLNFNMVTDEAMITAIWRNSIRTLTQTVAQIEAGLEGNDLIIHRGDTLSISLTGLGILSGRDKLYFTVKKSWDDSDLRSVIMIEETDGLVVLNGAVPLDETKGSLVVLDDLVGNISINLAASESLKLTPAKDLFYDVQIIRSEGGLPVLTLTSGLVTISADITRTVL